MRVLLEWVIDAFTKTELRQSWWGIVLDIQKGPLQDSYSFPAESTLVVYCVRVSLIKRNLDSSNHLQKRRNHELLTIPFFPY